MDWLTYIAGVSTTALGVLINILSTKKVEHIKRRIDIENKKKTVYIELNELADNCVEKIDDLYDLYAKSYFYSKQGDESLLNSYVIPSPPVISILQDNLADCFFELTKEQRAGLRTLIFLCRKHEEYLNSIEEAALLGGPNVRHKEVYLSLSTICSIYQIALNLYQTKDRFNPPKKDPYELMVETLISRNRYLEFTSISKYLKELR